MPDKGNPSGLKSGEAQSILMVELENGRTVEDELRKFRSLAKLLDTQFSFLGIRFGLDQLIGLVPVAGDVVTGIAGLYALFTAFRLKLPTSAKITIVLNLLFDTTIGAVPVIGDIIDFFFPAHARNFRVVEKQLAKKVAAYRKEQARRAADDQ